MFPDPTPRWQPFPSIIDGIDRPPFVTEQGLWRGVLHLVVTSPGPHPRFFFGVEIPCEAYLCIDEMIYSVADHGDIAGAYDGCVYIKEARTSALVTAYTNADPIQRKPRHFSFVGTNYCFEVLGFSEPTIHSFASEQEAYSWGPRRT